VPISLRTDIHVVYVGEPIIMILTNEDFFLPSQNVGYHNFGVFTANSYIMYVRFHVHELLFPK
jgi:hypothetical protein